MVSVRSGSVYELFLPDTFATLQSLHRRSAFTDFTLMSTLSVVVFDPFVQIVLELVDCLVDFLAERDLIELLQDGLMERYLLLS